MTPAAPADAGTHDLPLSTPHGIMLHHFTDARHPRGQGAISGDEFLALLQALGTDRILPAEEWTARTIAGGLREGDLCITFDDALRCQYDVALPVLEQLGLTAFWFVYSSIFEGGTEPLEMFRYFRTVAFSRVEDFYAAFDDAVAASPHADFVGTAIAGVDFDTYGTAAAIYTTADRRFRYLRDQVLGPERYEAIMWRMISDWGGAERIPADQLWLDDDCLRKLSASGHVIGLHSYSHPTALAKLPANEQREQYRRNHLHITRVTGRVPTVVSHPCNSYGPETLTILRDLGVKVGFRINMGMRDYSPLEQPRMDHALLMRKFGLGR